MAILFDELDDYFAIADAASLTFPDSDWCVGIWTRVTDNSGAYFQYLLSDNFYGVNNSLNLYLKETGAGTDANKWHCIIVDGDGTSVLLISSSAPGADGLWRLIVVQRRTADAQLQMWFCTPGGTPSLVASNSDTNFDAVDGGAWNVGRRVDGDADRCYGSLAAELFKGDFSLSQEEIAALGAGAPIYALGRSPSMYLIMGTSEATLRDLFGSNDATRSSAPTTAEHPPIVRPIGALAVTGVGVEPPPPPPPVTTPASRPYIRVLIADRAGRILAEVEPQVGPVSWRLNDVGRATLTFAKTDPNAIEDYLRFGNRLLIQFANGLPNWGGVIDPPRKWDQKSIQVTAYSGEYLLGFRQTDRGRYFDGATVGCIFQQLIQEVNAVAPTGVTIGGVWGGGQTHSPAYHFDNLLKIIQEGLTERLSTADFVVLAAEANGYITFTAHLYERRGMDKPGVVLLEDHNLAGIDFNEQGPITNCWDIVGQGTTWGDERPVANAEDAASIAAYGRREGSAVHTDTMAQTTLDETADNKLLETAWPRNVLTLEAADLTPARFADYDVGDGVRVMLHAYGFGGYDHLVRVLTREYDPAKGTCALVVQEAE